MITTYDADWVLKIYVHNVIINNDQKNIKISKKIRKRIGWTIFLGGKWLYWILIPYKVIFLKKNINIVFELTFYLFNDFNEKLIFFNKYVL